MRNFLIRAFKVLLALLFPGVLFAQVTQDYAILLHSGKYLPSENVLSITKDSEVLKQSLYLDRYYVLLQFKVLPTQEEKAKLTALGIRLVDYIPNNAYTASVPANFNLSQLKNLPVRSVFRLSVQQKTVPAVLAGKFPDHAVYHKGYADVTVITYETLDKAKIAAELVVIKAQVLAEMPMFRTFTIRVPQSKIKKLVDLPFVQWVEPIDPPNVKENLLGRSLHRVTPLQQGFRNLNGDGIKVGIWDGGEVSPHIDFSPVSNRLVQMEASSASDHGTHVAGTIAGRGIINPKAKGMAPNVTLYSYDYNGTVTSEIFNAIQNLNLDISSHSYGSTQTTCGTTGANVAYSSTSRATDINLNTYPNHLHVHSAGNSQTACTDGWSTITGSGKSAKNNILVANITSAEAISGSSSFGPVADGRVKPEISAFGTGVLSTYTPLNTYATISGTSMATPGVSGTLALLVQRYKQLNSNVSPISSLVKAVVCNNAADLGNAGPDYKFGFGRLNALAAIKALEENRYAVNTITTGTTRDITITVPAGAANLRVMLTWNDPAGSANANPALVNNLNLSVITGGVTTLPWKLDPNNPALVATRGVDNVSNIEQITIDNPAAGTYTLRVNGSSVPVGTQQYSLTWTVVQPFIDVIFPNGGESFSPGTQETITWDNAGVTTNQTIQYSVNNGTSWVTLSSSVPATTTRYIWTVPAGVNSANALIRVSSGALTDISDVVFNILGTPAYLNASSGACSGPGAISFTWPAVTNATHYDLFSLDATGQWTALASNITGTSYNTTLAPGANMWFTIRAKNTTSGSVSEKALAINKSISNSGGTPAPPTVTNGNSCGPGVVTLTATPSGSGIINWYAASTGGSPLYTGSTYAPTVSATTTYYSATEVGGNVPGNLPVESYAGGYYSLGGNMFDLTPNQNVSLTGFDVNSYSSAGASIQVSVYYKTGTYAGNETNAGTWTLHQTVTVTSAGQRNATNISINPLALTAGQVYGIYVNYEALFSSGSNTYANGDILVQTGNALSGNFSGVYSGYSFSGSVYYNATGSGCESARVPVTATITPTPATPTASYNNPVSAGGTLQLSSTTVPGATFSWVGPNGFASTLQNPTIANVSSVHEGFYWVSALVNGCNSAPSYIEVRLSAAGLATVSGTIRSENNLPVNGVSLSTTGGTTQNSITTATGAYSFNFSIGGNYAISAEKSNDVVANNGITTLDIVHVRRHLLGVQALGSPFKIIAADVNASNSVTTADIALMRSVILGISSSFSGQQWKFVAGNYVFSNPANPFPYNSSVSTLSFTNLSSSQTVDFIGLKLGDVNNTWDNTIARLQVAGDLHLLLPAKQAQPQDTVLVPVRVKDFTNVSGYQFTLEWNNQVLQYIGVVPAALQGAYSQQQSSNGKLTTTWDEPAGQSLSLADSTVIFQLKFKAIGPVGSVSPVSITSNLTKAESYNNQLAPLNLLATAGQVQIGAIAGVAEGLNQGYAFYQNYPNPFFTNTTFSFALPKTEEVSLVIYNNLGQTVAKYKGRFGKGESQLNLKDLQVNNLPSGAYYVSFTAGGFTSTKKMIVLK